MKILVAAIAVLLFSGKAAAFESKAATLVDKTLEQIIADHWRARLEERPTFATSVGVRDFDGLLGDPSLEAQSASMARAKGFLERLNALDPSALNQESRLNFQLLKLELENTLATDQYGGKYMAISNRSGPHTFITRLPDDLPFFTTADYESYAKRLSGAPEYIASSMQRLRVGVSEGWVQPCSPMEGFERSIAFHIVENPADSVLMKPFASRPNSVPERDWKRLKATTEKTVKDKVIPAFAAFKDFYETEYKPACRAEIGASSLPNGRAYYDDRVRFFTTTNMSADEVHALGLKEVARIRAEMATVIRSTGFKGDFKAFQEFLRTDPRFYATSAEELMEKNSAVAKRIDGELPKLFTVLPRMPYTLKEIPADIAQGTTTAYYERPAGDGSRAGVYRVNTSKLETRPLYEVEALTLHEAVPGHHLQVALAQELDLPEFRRYGGFTAFIEGWGLYAESLGLDVGFYQDPYSNFGRLSYEMWRACRLVVDTGMHARGWSRDQAIAFMSENTALSEHNIRAEVDRYIVGPGQALAYKVGQLKIQELRARAANRLGTRFDLRRFHDRVLANGAVPLSVLEAQIDDWIAAEKGQ